MVYAQDMNTRSRGQRGLIYNWMRYVKDIGPVSETSEIISLKIGVQFGTALNLGKR